MDKIMKKWFICGGFLCLFFIFQMFFAPANRLTIFMSYLTNLTMTMCLIYAHYCQWKRDRLDSFDNIKKTFERWDDIVRDFPHRCTWQCDICHQYRIDALISVVKYQDESKIVQLNIKYCNDNATCIAKAKTLDIWRGEKVYPMGEST